MLLDTDRDELQGLMQQKLGDTGNMLVVSGTLIDGSRGRPEGLLALGDSVIAFAAQDILSGEIWKQWPRNEVGPIQLDEDFMGAKLSFTFGGDSVALERIPKEFVASLKEKIQGQGQRQNHGQGQSQSRGQGQVNGQSIGMGMAIATAGKVAEVGGEGGADASKLDMVFEQEPTPVKTSSQRAVPPEIPAGAPAAPSGAWICHNCGKTNEVNYKFCLGCGEEALPPVQSGGSGPVEPRLVGLGQHAGEIHLLKEEICKIGRVQKAHLTIPSGSLSRLHAVIQGTGSTRTIVDLGSSNGTFVNGKRIDTATIQHGDRISFSDEHEFIFETMASASSSGTSAAASSGSPQTAYANQRYPGNQGHAGSGASSIKLVLVMSIGIALLGVLMMIVIIMGQ